MTSEKEFQPKAPVKGSLYALYRPPGNRRFFANIVLGDGHIEQFDTEQTSLGVARQTARNYVLGLCKARGTPTPKQLREKAGVMGTYERKAANRKAIEAGLPVPYPGKGVPNPYGKGKGKNGVRKPETSNDEETGLVPYRSMDQKWAKFLDRHAQRCVQFFNTISSLFILGQAIDNPAEFVDHCRALIIETMNAGPRKYARKNGVSVGDDED